MFLKTSVRKISSFRQRAAIVRTVSLLARACIPNYHQSIWVLGDSRRRHRELTRHLSYNDDTEKQFHQVTDETLELIQDSLCSLEDTIPDAEVSLSMGVLNINLGTIGTWVINKQTPNRQLWWSSPISGPRRYEYEPTADSTPLSSWRHSRDKTAMVDSLREEILQATGEKFFV